MVLKDNTNNINKININLKEKENGRGAVQARKAIWGEPWALRRGPSREQRAYVHFSLSIYIYMYKERDIEIYIYIEI